MRIDPYHLISTPIPILPHLEPKAFAGVSGEDPEGKRHQGKGFSVWLTIYSPLGQFLERKQIDELSFGARKFYNLSELTQSFKFKEPYLSVIHRVPLDLKIENGMVEIPVNYDTDFDMFRTVVQFADQKGGAGSVIYETPPHFNENPSKKGAHLSFSNQMMIGKEANTYLLLINYSVNSAYSTSAARSLFIFGADGSEKALTHNVILPFGIDVINLSELVDQNPENYEELEQYSYVACSRDASLIPLILNVNVRGGGVSLEHTHPPNSNLNMPMHHLSSVRKEAIEYFLAKAEALHA